MTSLMVYDPTPQVLTSGQFSEPQCDQLGRQLVALMPAVGITPVAGASFDYGIKTNPATKVVKATAGTLYGIAANNLSGSTRYLFIADRVDVIPNGAQPTKPPIPIAANAVGGKENGGRGFPHAVGIVWGISTTADTFTADTSATCSVETEYA